MSEAQPQVARGETLAFVWSFARPYRPLLAAAVAALLFSASVALTLPYNFRLIIDSFGGDGGSSHNWYFLLAILAIAFLALGSSLRNYLTKLLGERIGLDMRKRIFARMIHMSPAFFEQTKTGEILSRITADTTLISLVVGNSTSMAIRQSVMLAGGLTMLLVTSPKLTGLVMLVVPLMIGPIIAIGRRVRSNAIDNQHWIAESTARASEALFASETVQAFSAEGQSIDSFNAATGRAVSSARKMVKSHALMTGSVILLVFCGMVGVLWFGLNEVASGAITMGELVQFAFYVIIVATSASSFSDVWGETQRLAGAAHRLAALLAVEDAISDSGSPTAFPAKPAGRITFENVGFRYPSRPEVYALEDVSFSVNVGETVALVGPSGAGKSTVFQLLLRFYDPHQGCITVDGVDIKALRRNELRQHLAIVQQDPAVFAVTAGDNIRLGRPDATDADVEKAATAAAAHEFIAGLPSGYDTNLGEDGVMLSGGQKQRIAIARAILRDAPVLLLDEATSALDAQSERAIQVAIDELSKDRTTLVIAHRLATVESADRILVFDAGRVVAEGTHEDLIAKGGLYAEYARMQLIAPD